MSKLSSILFILILATFSCQKSDSDEIPEPVSNTLAIVQNTVVKGTWRVSYFLTSGNTKTKNFDGYNFTFINSGSVSSTNIAETVEGTWAASSDGGQLKLALEFTEQADFIELTDNWNIIERTDTKLRLEEAGISGGLSKNKLTFLQN